MANFDHNTSMNDVNGNDVEIDCMSLDTALLVVSRMPVANLLSLVHVLDNILDVMSVLDSLGFYDNLCDVAEDEDPLDLHERVSATQESHDDNSCTIDVTEDEILQLAAETEQDEGEKQDLMEGLRTLRKGAQEEVVLCLRSQYIDIDSKKESNESDDESAGGDHEDNSVEDTEDLSQDNELVLLPPEKYKTCPASSFAAVLKSRTESVKGFESDIERPRSESTSTTAKLEVPSSSSVPKKSRSMPDIIDEKKQSPPVSSTRKLFEKSTSSANVASKARAPWRPSGKNVAPKVKPKPAKFFTPVPKNVPEPNVKGLRARVLTRAAELNKKTGEEDTKSSKFVRKPRSVSKSIEEKTKLFSNEAKYARVYTRPTHAQNSTEKRPPWRYGKAKAPAVPLATIKPFMMRKAARKHELGLNRDQLKDLQSGLSQVFHHSHQSCPSTPARFGSLASSPLGRIPSSASRAAAATYASSNKPQTEYQGCEVCRLKEAMRNSPMSHKLKSAPHRCPSQASLTPKVVAVKTKKPKKTKLLRDSDVPAKSGSSRKKIKEAPFYSVMVPIAVFSLSFLLLFTSLATILTASFNMAVFHHVVIAAILRISFHCYAVKARNPVDFGKLALECTEAGLFNAPPLLYKKAYKLWQYLSKIYWKDAISYTVNYCPRTITEFRTILYCVMQDSACITSFMYNHVFLGLSILAECVQVLSPGNRQIFLMLLCLAGFIFAFYYPLPFFFSLLSTSLVPTLLSRFRTS